MEKMKQFVNKIFIGLIAVIIITSLFVASPIKAENEKIKVGFFSFNGYHNISSNGEKSGYGYEYLQFLSLYNDWEYEYIGYDKSWNEMQQMLENGDIDILTSAQKTTEREEKFLFSSDSIGVSATIFTVKAGDYSYFGKAYSDFNGIKVGMLHGNSRNESFDNFAQEKGFTYNPVYFNSVDELLTELQKDNSEINAAISSDLRIMNNEWIIEKFDLSPYYIMVNKNNKELLDQINNSITNLKLNYPLLENELYQKYYNVNQNIIPFYQNEREYIKKCIENNVIINVLIKPDNEPLSYIENGEVKGFLPQLFMEISKRSGLKFNFIKTNSRIQYEEYKKSGNYDILASVTNDLYEAEKNGYKTISSYCDINYVELFKKNNKNRETIAAPSFPCIAKTYAEKNFPTDKITYYNSYLECQKAVEGGKQDLTYMNQFSAAIMVLRDARNRLSYSSYPIVTSSFTFGINKTTNFELISILDKTINSFDQSYIVNLIEQENQAIYRYDSIVSFVYDNPVLLIIVISFILIIVIFIVFLISRNIRLKTIQDSNAELAGFINYICNASEELGEINIDTHERYRYIVKDNKIIREQLPNMTQKIFLDLVYPDDVSLVSKYINYLYLSRLIIEQGQCRFECRTRNDNLEYQWFSYTLIGREQTKSHSNNYIYIRQNINEIRSIEQEEKDILTHALEIAENASNTKSEFTSRMSHEMRTPLNTIIGYMYLAEDTLDDPEKTKEYLKKSKKASNQLLGIINDILDESSISNGKLLLKIEEFSMKEIINDINDIIYSQTIENNITYNVVNNNDDLIVLVDPLRLKQILINILGNAVKFTNPGGKITFTIRKQSRIKGSVNYHFIISDTGIGMDDDYKTRIFKPYEQGYNKNLYGGTGLGLTITKQLVEMMNGAIQVESKLNVGSTFTVIIPFTIAKENNSQINNTLNNKQKNKKEDNDERLKNKRVLIVEDNKINAILAEKLLERKGVNTEVAANGKIAIDMIVAKPEYYYQAILMDLRMPVLNGIEATKQIRELNRSDSLSIPIIAMTADAFQDDKQKTIVAGMNGYITKPIDPEELYNVLAKKMK